MIHARAATLTDTERWAARIAAELERARRAGSIDGALIGLSGELGAGKTAFVRAFVEAIDPARASSVCSPTYAVAQIYDGDPPIRHLDLYRIASPEELEAIGWRELYFGAGYALVEWIERMPAAIPEAWLEIQLAFGPGDQRDLSAIPHGQALIEVLNRWQAKSMG